MVFYKSIFSRAVLIFLCFFSFNNFVLVANPLPEKYVNSLKASLYQDSDLASSLVVEVNRGEKLYVLANKGLWSNVRYNQDITGWVYTMLLVDHVPEAINSRLSQMNEIRSNQRSRASLYSRSAAARGLSDSKGELDGKYPPNFDAVEKMEQFYVKESRALFFMIEETK